MLPLQRSTFCSLAIVFALLAAIASLRAAPPSDADPAMADWFGGLQQPNSGLPCCSIADCRVAEVRADSGGYDVKIDDVWMAPEVSM